METINIVWNDGYGHMTIYLKAFFPATQAQMKKLLSIIRLDWEHEEDLIAEINNFLVELLETAEEDQKAAAKKYMDVRQCLVDTQTIISEKKWPNGVPLKKDEVKQERERLKSIKADEKFWSSNFSRLKRTVQQIKKNIEQVKGR